MGSKPGVLNLGRGLQAMNEWKIFLEACPNWNKQDKTKFGPLLGPLGGGCSLPALSPKFQPHAGVTDDRIVIILHMGRTWGVGLWGVRPSPGGPAGVHGGPDI